MSTLDDLTKRVDFLIEELLSVRKELNTITRNADGTLHFTNKEEWIEYKDPERLNKDQHTLSKARGHFLRDRFWEDRKDDQLK